MWRYSISASASHEHNIAIILDIVNLKSLVPMLFPARIANQEAVGPLATADGLFYHFENPGQVTLDHIPKSAILEDGYTRVGVGGKNEIDLIVTLDKKAMFLHETLINIRFNDSHLSNETVTPTRLIQLTIDLALVIDANYIYVYDKYISRYSKTASYRDNQRKQYPMEVGWLAYFGSDLVELIGRERFDALKTYHEKISVGEGILLVLQDIPFDAHNPEHREREAQAIEELGLRRFIPEKRERKPLK